MEIMINQAITAHKEGRLEEAEQLYRAILKNQPTNLDVNNNLGVLLCALGRFDEAEASYRKAIELKPDYVQAHSNLSNALKELGRFDEAEASCRKAIELKPDYVEAHNNLGIILYDLNKFDEAEASYRKAIELKPDYVEANNNLCITFNELGRFDEAEVSYRKAIELKPDYELAHINLGNTLKELGRFNEAEVSYRKAIEFKPDYELAHINLGNTLKELGRFDEAEVSYRKAIEFKPNHELAHKNLNILLKHKKLLSKIEQAKKSEIKTKIRLTSNPFISNRKVEAELISQLYKIDSKKLDDVDPEYLRYGNGRSSNYELFENNFSTIKTVEKDLINIMKEAVNSDIFISESFFNIFQTGSGIIFHDHLDNFDNISGLVKQKFSLSYYLDIGDQNCSEPGTLKLQDPDKEILPSEGMIVIFPASRKHSATYGGEKDRVMIGINFYSLI